MTKLEKTCRHCGKVKSVLDFEKRQQCKSGRDSVCKRCRCNDKREHYHQNPELRKAQSQRSKRYWEQLPLEEKQRRTARSSLIRKQNQLAAATRPKPDFCECCGSDGSDRQPYGILFDHNHSTGKFRGWICARCNICLGYVEDNPERLLALAAYLRTHAD